MVVITPGNISIYDADWNLLNSWQGGIFFLADAENFEIKFFLNIEMALQDTQAVKTLYLKNAIFRKRK